MGFVMERLCTSNRRISQKSYEMITSHVLERNKELVCRAFERVTRPSIFVLKLLENVVTRFGCVMDVGFRCLSRKYVSNNNYHRYKR